MRFNIDLNRFENIEYYIAPNMEEKIFPKNPIIVDGIINSNHITTEKMELIKYEKKVNDDFVSCLKMNHFSEPLTNTKYIRTNSSYSLFKRHKFLSMYLVHSIYKNKRFFENSKINTAEKQTPRATN